jgi:hypothetical protein
MTMRVSLWRSRWAAIGAAVAVAFGAGGLGFATAVTPPASNPVTTLITPCRLLDTRTSPYTVGTRNTPIGTDEAFAATVWGTNGNCTIPSTAVGIITNVTIVNPTASSYLAVWPADKVGPNGSNLNWVPGQNPTPNQVTAALSVADGKIDIYNHFGTVDVVVDITGYLTPADLTDYYTKGEVDAAVFAASQCRGYPHRGVDWQGCNLQGANLTGARLDLAILDGADLDGANLTGAQLVNVVWSNTTCPDGTNSDTTIPHTSIGHGI